MTILKSSWSFSSHLIEAKAKESPILIIESPAVLPDGTQYIAQVPRFVGYEKPFGYLPPDIEAHALFMYNLMARRLWEAEVNDPIHYEGTNENYHGPNFRKLFEQVAAWYSCDSYKLVNYWLPVVQQCETLEIPVVPDEERYRFNTVSEVRLQILQEQSSNA